MTFTWPIMLLALLLVPVLALVYLLVIRRRNAVASDAGLRFTSGLRGGARRHLAPALFLLAIALLLFSLSRPKVVFALPHLEGTVILAFDVSSSMKADDLKPTRMDAAKEAARTFVKKQPRSVKVGIVAFSDNAFALVQPTDQQDELLQAIDRLSPQGATSVSEGIFGSLAAIAGKPLRLPENATEADIVGMDIGHFGSAVIVMLTDGEHTSRVDPLQVAEVASGAGVRIYPIGLGKPQGATLNVDGFHLQTTLNEGLLKAIAEKTEGTYLRAEDEQQLTEIYRSIDLQLTSKGDDTEITSFLAMAAMVVMCVGAALTIRWFGRVP